MPNPAYHHDSRRIVYNFLLLFALLLLACFTASPAQADPWQLGHDIPYSALSDPHGELSLVQAEASLGPLVLQERSTFSRGYVRDTFWLRFELSEDIFNGQERWLELGPNFIDDIQLFLRPVGSSEPW